MRCHGFLVDLTNQLRAYRFFCSNRNGNKGCGKTRSVYLEQVIPKRAVDTTELFFLFLQIAATGFVLAGWNKAKQLAGSDFQLSLASAYRWHRLFHSKLPEYRSKLYLQVRPPPDNEVAASPNPELVATIKMFDEAKIKGCVSPFSSFQLYHQRPIF